MKQICNKNFTRMIFILCGFFLVLSLEKLVVHAISFRLSEAELSMHLIPENSF